MYQDWTGKFYYDDEVEYLSPQQKRALGIHEFFDDNPADAGWR